MCSCCRKLIRTCVYVVSIWILCVTLRAGALSNLDGEAINEQPGRGQPSLEAKESLEAVSKWQERGRDGGSQDQGTVHQRLLVIGS